MSDPSIRSVAVVGGGIVGLSAALTFRRALPGATITVVSLPVDPAALADRMPTAWPSVGLFHRQIGLDELDLVRSGVASHHLGTIMSGWGSEDWVHAFGPHGRPVGAVHFDQIWVQAHNAGRARPYDHYSAPAVLARAGKFLHPPRDPKSPLAGMAYGLRLDPDRCRARLAEQARSADIRLVETRRIESVERTSSGGIASLQLEGESVEADLFLDCSGPEALLISEVDDSFEEWPSHAVRRLRIEDGPRGTPTSAARITAKEDGWTAEWPLRDRTIRCVAGGDGDIALRPGRRTRPWASNVLALGDAAAAFDPLHGMNLALAHRALFLALELLPGRDFNPLELAEFSRRWCLITNQIRDFVALHYVRRGVSEPPPELARRLDQYGNRGRLPFQEDEILNRDDWSAALLGLGVIPRNVDPSASGIPQEKAFDAMDKLADELASGAERVPDYETFLAHIPKAT